MSKLRHKEINPFVAVGVILLFVLVVLYYVFCNENTFIIGRNDPRFTSSNASIADWKTFGGKDFGVQFRYPDTGIDPQGFEGVDKIHLPHKEGTNLIEKYLEVSILQGQVQNSCGWHKIANATSPRKVVINGMEFTEVRDSGEYQGSLDDEVTYSIVKGDVCLVMHFVLHYAYADVFTPPRPQFNKADEEAIYQTILSTIRFTN
jgi:hypothetical protein